MTDQTQRIALLERKIERERRARKAAEQQLESYSQELYYANQALKRAMSESGHKQTELQFLANASEFVTSDMDLQGLMSATVELTANYVGSSAAGYLVLDGQQAMDNEQWIVNSTWKPKLRLGLEILPLLPKVDELLQNWFMFELLPEVVLSPAGSRWLVAINFQLPSRKRAWICLLFAQELLDEKTLFVLDTAKNYLRSGITKRLSATKIQQKDQQLKDSNKRLETAREQLQHSEKMASLGQLAAGVAHEINNPIGFIRANQSVLHDYFNELKLFIDDLLAEANAKETVSLHWLREKAEKLNLDFIIEDSQAILHDNTDGVERVADIVSSLKTFSHGADQSFASFDIRSCVDSALKIAGNAVNKDHAINVSMPKEEVLVYGNTSQIQQVLVNLVVNAGQAMAEPGQIGINLLDKKHWVKLDVVDSGCGMDKPTMDKLFTPFFTTKPVGEGTGLGLSVSLGIIESHGGKIEVASKPGKGSRFSVMLPAMGAGSDGSLKQALTKPFTKFFL